MEANKLWVADAVTGGGGAMVPFRGVVLDVEAGIMALFP